MALTPKQRATLLRLRRSFYCRTAQIRKELIRLGLLKKDDDGAHTRGIIRSLEKLGYVRRYNPKLIGDGGTVAPIFVLTILGSAALAQDLNDCSMLLTVEPNFKDWMSLDHHCAVGELHVTTDRAFERQDYVKLRALYFEHEVIKPDAEDPSKKFRLYTVVTESPRIPCCPDSAMEIEVKGWRRCLLTEYETGADGSPARVAAKKHKGHFGMASKQLYKRFFPEARDSRVLAFCPYESWMNHLRSEMKGKPGAEFWLFCDTRKVTPETFLHGDIFYSVDKGPFALVPPPVPASPPPGEGRGERGEEETWRPND